MNPRAVIVSIGAVAATLHVVVLYAQNAEPVQRAPVRSMFVTQFPDKQPERIPVGNFDNVAFAISLKDPSRRLSAERIGEASEVIASYDYADCSKGQEPLLEKPVAKLRPGDAAWVDYIDIELASDGGATGSQAGGVCYGTRGPEGKWRWTLTSTPLTYAADGKRLRGRLWIKDGPIDAIKLVFDHAMPRQHIESVAVVAQPFDKRQR